MYCWHTKLLGFLQSITTSTVMVVFLARTLNCRASFFVVVALLHCKCSTVSQWLVIIICRFCWAKVSFLYFVTFVQMFSSSCFHIYVSWIKNLYGKRVCYYNLYWASRWDLSYLTCVQCCALISKSIVQCWYIDWPQKKPELEISNESYCYHRLSKKWYALKA